jgi:hypothetical protein
MKKVAIHSKVPQSIKDELDRQAKEKAITPSKHIGEIVEKHVSKTEVKPTNKKEYGNQ